MTFMERWYHEVWNEGREESIHELFAAHGIAHGLTDPEGRAVDSRDGFKAYFRTLRAALSEIHVVVDDVMIDGDRTAARCTVTARHTGEGLGIVPAGKPLKFSGMSWARIEDGQIVEAWNNFDFMTMVQQMQ